MLLVVAGDRGFGGAGVLLVAEAAARSGARLVSLQPGKKPRGLPAPERCPGEEPRVVQCSELAHLC